MLSRPVIAATTACVTPLQRHGRLAGAVAVRSASASIDSSSYNVKDLLLQISELKQDKVSAEKDKEDLRQARALAEQAMLLVEKAKDELKEANEKTITLLEEDKEKLQRDLFEAKIKAMALTDMRFLLEVSCKSVFKGVTATAATQSLAKEVLNPQNLTATKLQLYDDAKGWLKLLMGKNTSDTLYKDEEQRVCKQFPGLYSILSADFHQRRPGVSTDDPGMYIGGKPFSVRAAVAILVLEAQKREVFDIEPIYFCDDQFIPKFQLSRGVITKLAPISS